MKFKINSLVISLVTFLSLNAHSFYIEPYAGYGFADYEQVNTAGTTYSGDINGPGYGLRLGVSLPLVFFGFDGMYSIPKVDGDFAGDGTLVEAGVVAGVSVPLGLRVWAGYNFYSSLEIDLDDSATNLKYEGVSYKAGVGFRVIPMLYLNAEYIIHDFDEVNDVGFGTLKVEEFDYNLVFLSIGIPVSF